jgi:hypothetical protein
MVVQLFKIKISRGLKWGLISSFFVLIDGQHILWVDEKYGVVGFFQLGFQIGHEGVVLICNIWMILYI